MNRTLHEYTEDDPNVADVPDRTLERQQEVEVLIETWPHFGHVGDRSETAELQVRIEAEELKHLKMNQLSRLVSRARLPKPWVKSIKEELGKQGWWLVSYKNVEIDMKQKRLSDTDGGYPAMGEMTVEVIASMESAMTDAPKT